LYYKEQLVKIIDWQESIHRNWVMHIQINKEQPQEETGPETPKEFRIHSQQRNKNSQSKKGRN
jgi:hypothetical protein